MTASKLFEHIDEDPADPERRDMLEGYFREVSRMVIDWMATSEEGTLREAQERIRESLSALPPSHPANRTLRDGEWLGVRLRGLSILISTYLSTVNLGRSLGALSGERYAAWQRALQTMAEAPRRPVRAMDLVRATVFPKENTASHALNRLAELGLVAKAMREGAAIFTLTWAGESFARSQNAKEQDDATSEKLRVKESLSQTIQQARPQKVTDAERNPVIQVGPFEHLASKIAA